MKFWTIYELCFLQLNRILFATVVMITALTQGQSYGLSPWSINFGILCKWVCPSIIKVSRKPLDSPAKSIIMSVPRVHPQIYEQTSQKWYVRVYLVKQEISCSLHITGTVLLWEEKVITLLCPLNSVVWHMNIFCFNISKRRCYSWNWNGKNLLETFVVSGLLENMV